MIPILDYKTADRGTLLFREEERADVSAAVSEIIARVRQEGDAALFRFCRQFNGAALQSLQVTEEEFSLARSTVDPAFLAVLETAAANIRAFHSRQLREGFRMERGGRVLGQRILPIERVGLCVPGGETPLSSTVLMDAIPAKLAGCRELVLVTPARRDGSIDPSILAAAQIAGVDKIFKLGGAQAVAALAYGTESVPRVDKIVGPGGVYVAEAKRQVFGQVAIDMIAGPSEVLVVADGKTSPAHIAADMLSQAEHDPEAAALLVTDSSALALAVQAEIERQLPTLAREEIARASIQRHGKILVTEDLEAAIQLANELAPEHLELCVDEPFVWLERVQNAGSVFLGRYSPEVLGDYYAGTNHTLPTNGTARFSSPLSVDDFIKKIQYIYYPEEDFRAAAADIACFAQQEGLTAHARSALIRREEDL